MFTLKKVSLALRQPTVFESLPNQDCYLIIIVNSVRYFTKTAQPDGGTFLWNIDNEEHKISFNSKNSSLVFSLVHYDNCRQLSVYSFQLKQDAINSINKTYEQYFSSSSIPAKLSFQFDFELNRQASIRQNVSSFARNSKKTNTTNYQQPPGSPTIQKISSLKLITNYRRELEAISSAQSPKYIGELAYLRSFRENLQKKLFTSMGMESKGKKKYVV